ncbi:transcriptional regulator, RpiR family [Clostridium sp. DSM 8431]|uniref:MurR/RpiR family transcriptional regulator n=1 Tax=Clostridium sp. DSM 8431 TaxID=1761781 RepID=UPI0008DFB83E|nr:MurR/RpiR family transcriptional regulator [Clostridium sp. DSM 8431]SFU88275.1 transcriptional regulator, RpiR family [Clostridium sp. DSM 8431]
MNINRMSLLGSLFSVINESNHKDTNYVLAQYFLENYHKLSELNIFNVAEECYVSRSSIRRFCKSIGYENFVELKKQFAEYDDQYKYYMMHSNRENYRELLTNEINEMIKELDKRMNEEEVERIADKIYKSRYVVFLTSDTSTAVVQEFQKSMIFFGKVIKIISDVYTDKSLISSLDERDVLFVISSTGTFAKASRDFIEKNKAEKILITVNRDEEFKEWYDKIYHLSSKDRSKDGRSVYGKYGISYMFDIIYSAYLRKYRVNKR